jgi:hypothetical protein
MTYASTQAQMRQLETRNVVRKYNQEPIVYKRFAASKMSDSCKKNTLVEFTDLLGRKHSIPVRTKRQMREAQEFLSMFKRESSDINAIISEYPMTYGKVDEKFVIDCMSELLAYGLTEPIVEKLIGY